jgi:mono/diheme cytochrome c family protein
MSPGGNCLTVRGSRYATSSDENCVNAEQSRYQELPAAADMVRRVSPIVSRTRCFLAAADVIIRTALAGAAPAVSGRWPRFHNLQSPGKDVNKWRSAIGTLAFMASCAAETQTASLTAKPSAPEMHPARDTLETSIERGAIAFQHYCSLCHGVTGEGNGRAAKLYTPRPANLQKTDKEASYIDLIVRRGGAAIGRSQFMPPWDNELTDEQIRDLVNYIQSISAATPPK